MLTKKQRHQIYVDAYQYLSEFRGNYYFGLCKVLRIVDKTNTLYWTPTTSDLLDILKEFKALKPSFESFSGYWWGLEVSDKYDRQEDLEVEPSYWRNIRLTALAFMIAMSE